MEENTEAPPEYASVASLLQSVEQAETFDVTLTSGAVVAIRGLTRRELLDAGKGTEDSALIEARNVAFCLVRPTMTLAQVQQWQQAPGSVRGLRDADGGHSGRVWTARGSRQKRRGFGWRLTRRSTSTSSSRRSCASTSRPGEGLAGPGVDGMVDLLRPQGSTA
jgi:hypothetical protein